MLFRPDKHKDYKRHLLGTVRILTKSSLTSHKLVKPAIKAKQMH